MYNNHTVRFAHARRREYERAVQGGLSLTPAEMMEMAKKGQPIAAGAPLQETFDNTPQGDFYVPMETRRGIDINDLFGAQMESKSKLRKLKQQQAAQQQEGV